MEKFDDERNKNESVTKREIPLSKEKKVTEINGT